jgi:hypothetical protein
MQYQVFLSVTEHGGVTKTITLEKDKSLFVGSGPNCRLVLTGTEVNSMHCMIWLDAENVLRVKDWNTDGKTVLNGRPIESETVFSIGDKLDIGPNQIVPVLNADLASAANDESPDNDTLSPAEPTNANESYTEQETIEFATQFTPGEESNDDDQQMSDSEVAQFKYDPDLAEEDDDLDDGADAGADFFHADNQFDNEEVELLQMEVEQLRFELAERDVQIQPTENSNESHDEEYQENGETVRLVNRLEELLDELQSSDERVRGLEELLRASDQATQAEREERCHLESWVEEIEQRVTQREAESAAELSRLQMRLEELRARSKQEKAKLKEAWAAKNIATPDAKASIIQSFRDQIEELETRLEQAREESEKIRGLRENTTQESSQEFKLLEQKHLQLEVSTARERAEMARQQEQLERLKNELQQSLNEGCNRDNADSKIRAMRQHLHEIHEQELSEKKRFSLSGRISNLLSRTSRP